MNKKEISKQMYVHPLIEIIKTETECQLLNGSDIYGGHNQGHVGGGKGDAKKGWFDEDEEEENLTTSDENYHPWGPENY